MQNINYETRKSFNSSNSTHQKYHEIVICNTGLLVKQFRAYVGAMLHSIHNSLEVIVNHRDDNFF